MNVSIGKTGQVDHASSACPGIVGVDQNDALAVAHRGERVQQVGAEHGIEAEQHVSSDFAPKVARSGQVAL
jgi:hypothetical protein